MKLIDNATPHMAIEYDENVVKTIPYIELFHEEAIDLVKSYNMKCDKWLDVGCGTGSLTHKAYKVFKDTKFILADSSVDMINIARNKLRFYKQERIQYIGNFYSQQMEKHINENVDIITAIQVHHYLSREDRETATKNCFNVLNKNGMYITFENICPESEMGIEIGLERWMSFQTDKGKPYEKVMEHKDRFNKAYFPITIREHLDLLKKVGFRYYEVFWVSHMQCGLYAVK